MLSDLHTPIIVGLLVGGVGLILIYANWRVFFLENQARSWFMVVGEISRSELGHYFPRNNRGPEWFYPDIEYHYEVGGAPYTGKILDLVQLSQHGAPQYGYYAQTVLATIEEYPIGMQVPVYFDAANPATAVLRRKASRTISFTFFLGLVFVLAAPLIMIILS